MAIQIYLAMTAAEIAGCSRLPPKIAWMSCHFSPSGKGLSNLPASLPPGSLLVLDDSMAPGEHDPALILETLSRTAEHNRCGGLLLDFQRKDNPIAAALIAALSGEFPCPVAVSRDFAGDWEGAVFLPPVPPWLSPERQLAPWKGRDIWLEIADETQVLRLTQKGCEILPGDEIPASLPHRDEKLKCSYNIRLAEHSADFTLRRSRRDLEEMLEAVEGFGVTRAVGLYQEFSGI